MKFKYFSTLLPISFITVTSAVAEDVVYTDIYATKDFSAYDTWSQTTYFTSPAKDEIWADAEGNFYKPSATTNLHITADTYRDTGVVSGYGAATVHDVNYNIRLYDIITKDEEGKIIEQKINGKFKLIEAGNCGNLNILGDMNVTLDDANKNWATSDLYININTDDTYNVHGNMNIVNKDTYKDGDFNSNGLRLFIANQYLPSQVNGAWQTTEIHQNTKFSVGGDLNFTQTAFEGTLDKNIRAQSMQLITSLNDFEVGGVLSFDTKYVKIYNTTRIVTWNMKWKLGTKAESLSTDKAFDSYITLGGLSGKTILTMTEDFDAENHKVDLTFTNKKGVDTTWEGTYTNATLNKFEITMSGDAEGKQTMIFDDQSTAATGFIIDLLTLSGGEFALQNLSELEVGKLVLNGGKFTSLGTAKVTDAEFSAGKILVDTDSMFGGNEQLTISGTLEKSGTDKVLLDFAEFDASDFADTGDSFVLISAENINGFGNDANADFAATNLNGAEANFSWVDNYLTVNFTTVVPEPATIAGIAGLLALAFAVYRRFFKCS